MVSINLLLWEVNKSEFRSPVSIMFWLILKINTLLDPIIISDSVHYSYSDVLKVPSDISDHDASIIFIECPKFQTRSFQREVWLYERTDHFFAILRIRSRFLISLLSSLLNHGLSLLRIVTILVGMHSLATLRNVSVKVLHISSTSSKSESNASDIDK
jgi:hypothetical protein